MAWSDTERATLTAILDILIPANPARGIPGAGKLGVAGFLADLATRDPQFEQTVSSLLQLAQDMADGVISPDLVRRIEAARPEAFQALLVETYKGYYSRPDMRAKMGLGAHAVHPAG